ncbi:hypothetical protein [Stenotrophomonas maltophilia]|uniref:hypothetical protein n=1 Tax=Stenotrophomonas maltophilia TaxID=40324 RepID=UPI0021C588C9|nr:hypothetical protein [Stenotrophomonas maltophilia]MCU1172781.1 hypothetical protein [Stenotrophomonas maltophilia]
MKAKQAPLFCLLLGLSMAAAVTARECPVEAPRQIPPTVLTGGFFDAHPDLFWRSMAQRAERDRQPARALDNYWRPALTPSVEIGRPDAVRDDKAVDD